jgi:stage V sporulation protein G
VEITEVRIKLMEESEDRLRAFCSITFDHCFVVRDLKIIDGSNGPFVAMPSRKLTSHCKRCGHKNHLRAQFCNQCGARVRSEGDYSNDPPQKLYADVAHPVNSECREMIQGAVIAEFAAELERAGQPGYCSRYDDEFSDGEEPAVVETSVESARHPKQAPPPPHFDRVAGQRTVDALPTRSQREDDDDQDSFGAGIL